MNLIIVGYQRPIFGCRDDGTAPILACVGERNDGLRANVVVRKGASGHAGNDLRGQLVYRLWSAPQGVKEPQKTVHLVSRHSI